MHDWGFERSSCWFCLKTKSLKAIEFSMITRATSSKSPLRADINVIFKARYTRVKFTRYMKLVYLLKRRNTPKEQNDEAFSKVIASAEIAESRMVEVIEDVVSSARYSRRVDDQKFALFLYRRLWNFDDLILRISRNLITFSLSLL